MKACLAMLVRGARLPLAFLVPFLLVVGTACHPTPKAPNLTERRYENLIRLARTELDCRELDYEYRGDDVHRMQGCGSFEDYVLYCPGRICEWARSPAKQAAFEMSCPLPVLRISQITPTVYSVQGCDRRRSYVLQGGGWSGQDVAGPRDELDDGAEPAEEPAELKLD